MRYMDLLEALDAPALVNRLNRSIERTVETFVKQQTKGWRNQAIKHRREQLGYHPYYDDHKGFKTFDQKEFDAANRNWSPDTDWIGDRINDLVPSPTKVSSHPIYALMNRIGNIMTQIVQDHLRKNYGEVVRVCNGSIYRPVYRIRVLVWWTGQSPADNYLGVYRCNSYHDNGNETLLEIIIDREKWARTLRTEVESLIRGEGSDFSTFSHDIVNTFMHEYAHLEQDIRGRLSSLTLIPGKKGRYGDDNYLNDPERYLARPSEIDAHAVGAAAETVNKIINLRAQYTGRWDRDWTPEKIRNEEWNKEIQDAIIRVSHGNIPSGEYQKYVNHLNRRIHKTLPADLKDKFLRRVRQRFIRAYINRLRKYLRPEDGKKLAGPVGTLPRE